MEKFQDMKYERPDIKKVKSEYLGLVKQFKNAASFEEASDLIKKIEGCSNHLLNAYQLAYIRNTINTADTFYSEEVKYWGKTLPAAMPMMKKYSKALVSSKWRPQLEEAYGKLMFTKAENDIRNQSLLIIPDMIKENNICLEYRKLTSSCSVEYNGEQCNFYGLLKYMEDPDREIRKGAFEKFAGIYKEIAPKLDDIYDRLIKVRCRMAKKLGYPDYISYIYKQRERFDYTPEDVEKFRRQIREVVVPACEKIYKRQAERIGVDKIKCYDENYMFPEGNPTPSGTTEEKVALAREMYRELSPETGEFFDFMCDYQLFDLETKPNKDVGGYCTALPDYLAPFIFSNFNGTGADVDVLTHEAGHAFEGYTAARSLPLTGMCFSTSEINEIHSMSMEHFTYPWMEKFFGDDADRRRYSHLTGALLTVPYLVSVDAFQHKVFENPGMSHDDRRKVWKEIEETYMPWRDYDGEEYMSSGGFWMQKLHIFLHPFYYVDYALAQMGAFEYYGMMKQDYKKAWEGYLNLCRSGGSRGYFDTLRFAGLSIPFEDGTVQKAAGHVIEEIEASPFN